MQNVYDSTALIVFVAAFVMMAVVLWLSKDKLQNVLKQAKIRSARRTIKKYTLQNVFSQREIKTMVVDYLSAKNLIIK